jgi:hypothetical protein
MVEQTNRAVTQAATQMAENIANFLPGLAVFLLILLFSMVVAIVARLMVLRLLRRLAVDRRASVLGLEFLREWSASGSVSVVLAWTVYWLILVMGLLAALTALDAALPGEFAVAMLRYLPKVVAALLIFVVGNVLARFLARSVLIGAVNMQIPAGRLLSVGVRWLVIVLTTAMALEQLQIGQQILLLAFGIAFGGIVLTLALAVGLGSKDVVSRSIERQIRGTAEGHDTLDHV